MKTMTRQQRRAQERNAAKAMGSNRKLIWAGAFYKDNDLLSGFSMGGGSDQPHTIEVITKFYNEARKAYGLEAEACKLGNHPDYINTSMDQVVDEALHNMQVSIQEWNKIIYGQSTRKMGMHNIEFNWSDVYEVLFSIILGIVYGELHGLIESDEYNGMCFTYMN